jgi:hypothetical protein
MYLPASELQQYKGQWVCPICIQDMRDADRRASEYRPGNEPMRILSYSEQCERCGRDLETVYIWNGRRLCKPCMGEEQEKWGLVGGGPSGASQKVSLQPLRIAKKRSLLQHLIDEFLGLLGLKKKKAVEVVAVEGGRMPISRAKPMQEDRMKKKSYKKGKVEGLMKAEEEEGRDMKLDSEGIVTNEGPKKKASKKKAVPKKRKRRKKKPKK